ncbi:MAG: hypothetical protein AB8G99_18550 [Planctomycetaceae bacterium]
MALGNERRVLCYAFGGGLGHLTRSLALIRQLAVRVPGTYRLLANSPFAACVESEVARVESLEFVVCSPSANARGAMVFVRRQLEEFRPTCLIVDVFPRGLGGEFANPLGELSATKRVLVSRHLPAEYVESFRLINFVKANYDMVIECGERSPFSSHTNCVQTAPFLIRSANEIEPTDDSTGVVIVGSGTHEECDELRLLANRVLSLEPTLPVRFLDPNRTGFPVINLIASAQCVVGAAGYNLAHETTALGVPAMLVPRRRKYDDQQPRSTSLSLTAEDVIRFIRNQPIACLPRVHLYQNGAEEAATLIGSQIIQAED